MSKLQEIERKLIQVNDAVFQNVCDALLYFTESNYPNLMRSGSQKGKQKTTKGTPDSSYQLPNGRYVLVEYTTVEKKDSKKKFIGKIGADIEKCLKEKVTGIKIKDISKIIYCHNSTLTLKEKTDIINKYKAKKVKIEMKDLGDIALSIYGRCPHVARELLGINIDSGQIQTPKTFSEEYSSNGFATTITNKFYYRETELANLVASINSTPITILTGPPGVGKSRIALAAFDKLKEDKKLKYVFYCISNKNAPIFDDMRSYLLPDKNYVVLIDDANRQLNNLLAILPLLKEKRKGSIRIVITVRDYAFDELFEKCIQHNPEIIPLKKFTDDQLTEILKSDDFNITNQDYIRRIHEIADGNARLAIMAATLAKEKQTLQSLADVSELYDKYFSQAVKDKRMLKDKTLLKTMGIVSFFYSIDRTNRDFCDPLLKLFNLDYYKFNEAIDKLEKLEMIETSADFAVAKVSEQVLSTYFFYKTFFKDSLLDFSIILDNYFESCYGRIPDTVISSNNTFGYENVYNKITPSLDAFWKKIQNDENTAFKFLDLFWFYRPDDVFSFVYMKNAATKTPKKSSYLFIENSNREFSYVNDRYIELLSGFFDHSNEHFSTSIELAFDYTKRNPKAYTSLIDKIRESCIFLYDDQKFGFFRQNKLTEFLIEKSERDSFYTVALFEILPKFLKTSNHVVTSGRTRGMIRMYEFQAPNIIEIRELRKKIWQHIDSLFSRNGQKCISFLFSYLERSQIEVIELYNYDIEFLEVLIRKHFKIEDFEHCYLVHELNYMFKRMNISDNRLIQFKTVFNNDTYKLFRLLDHNRFRDKEYFEFNDYTEYGRIKEDEWRTVLFKDVLTFKDFYEKFKYLSAWRHKNHSDFYQALDMILENNARINLQLGIDCLKEIIKDKNGSYTPWLSLGVITASNNVSQIEKFHSFILNSEFKFKSIWMLRFYRFLPESMVDKTHTNGLCRIFTELDGNLTHFDIFRFIDKFIKIDKGIFLKLLKIIYQKNEEGKIRIMLEPNFFQSHIEKFTNNIDFLKKLYLQQDKLDNNFDYDLKEFWTVLERDRAFFLDYIKFILKDRYSVSSLDYHLMSHVWKLPKAENLVKDALIYVASQRLLSIEEHFGNCFFKHLDASSKEKSIKVIASLFKRFKKDVRQINMLFDIVRHSFKENLEYFVHLFLLYNSDVDFFKRITFLNNWFSSNGDIVWGDVRKAEWEVILNLLNRIKEKPYRFAGHKSYIREQIQMEQKSADSERKRMFMENRW